jgi:hypothetical protein
MRNYFIIFLILKFFGPAGVAQTDGKSKQFVEKLFKTSLNDQSAFQDLSYISNRIGSRLPASRGEVKMIGYLKGRLDSLVDNTTQKLFNSVQWVRGTPARGFSVDSKDGRESIKVAAAMGATPTRQTGTEADILALESLADFDELSKEQVSGKFILLNISLETNQTDVFDRFDYLKSKLNHIVQKSSRMRAMGVLMRSLCFDYSGEPHSYWIHYGEEVPIPVAFLNPEQADFLSTLSKLNPKSRFSLSMNCRLIKNKKRSVLNAELKAKSNPAKEIVLQTPLNSSDLGDGIQKATSTAQFLAVFELFKKLNYQPKHDIRLITVPTYPKQNKALEDQINTFLGINQNSVVIKNNQGGENPIGFQFPEGGKWKTIKSKANELLGDQGIAYFPQKKDTQNNIKMLTNSQGYFDLINSEADKLDKVNSRELALGTAALATLIYTIDQNLD